MPTVVFTSSRPVSDAKDLNCPCSRSFSMTMGVSTLSYTLRMPVCTTWGVAAR